MNVYVDFSIFVASGKSFGYAAGKLEFKVCPQIGDTISFQSSINGGVIPYGVKTGGLLKIIDRIFDAANPDRIALMLEDMEIESEQAALSVSEYLEKRHLFLVSKIDF